MLQQKHLHKAGRQRGKELNTRCGVSQPPGAAWVPVSDRCVVCCHGNHSLCCPTGRELGFLFLFFSCLKQSGLLLFLKAMFKGSHRSEKIRARETYMPRTRDSITAMDSISFNADHILSKCYLI